MTKAELAERITELEAVLREADSHITWCRHHHGVVTDFAYRAELDEWISRARSAVRGAA